MDAGVQSSCATPCESPNGPFGDFYFSLPWRFEPLRFAQPQPCCVPDLDQAARSSSVCKPTRLADRRIPYAYGKRSNPMRIWHYCWKIATSFGSCEVQTSKRPRCKTLGERFRKTVNISLKCAKDIRLFTVRKIFTSITNTYYDRLKYIQKRLWIIYK